jgi:hypothetical protein
MLFLALGESLTARAADPGTERARALFEQAGEFERRGQWAAAQEQLRSALHLRETPQLHYALGWALENDDKLLDARAEYEAAARLGRERPGGDEAVRLATTRLTELDKKTPLIKVRLLGGAKASGRVFVDGHEVKREEDVASTPVNPGSHVVRVERNGTNANEQMVYVGRGAVRLVEIEAGDVPVLPLKPSAPPRRAPLRSTVPASAPVTNERGNMLLPFLLVSGGIAFSATGAALLLSADSDADVRDSMQTRWCAATACTRSEGPRRETTDAAGYRRAAIAADDAAATKQALGLVLGGAGLVAGTIGVILLLNGQDGAPRKNTRANTRPRAGAATLPGGGAATAAFSF